MFRCSSVFSPFIVCCMCEREMKSQREGCYCWLYNEMNDVDTLVTLLMFEYASKDMKINST